MEMFSAKIGLLNNRNKCDEKYLYQLNQNNNGLIIFDARSSVVAMANRFKGGGTENPDNYFGTKLLFCDIENIHAVSESYSKICQLDTR